MIRPDDLTDEEWQRLRDADEYLHGSANGQAPPGSDATEATVAVPVLVTLADVEPQQVWWLWAGRLPAGKVVVLDGDPDLGKSSLSIDMAARLSTGTDWPDGTPCPLGDSVILSAEDDIADTIRPRLDAAGGDPKRVHVLTQLQNPDGTTRLPTLADVLQLRAAIERHQAKLLVVDVLMAYLPGGTDSHRDQDVRSVLNRIKEMAAETGCTVLLLRHLNKTGGGSPLYRGGGSIGIIGSARAGFVVAPDPDDPERKVFACAKGNLARKPPSLTYTLTADEQDVVRVEWGEESRHRAADLLTADDMDDRREIDLWLQDYMDNHAQAVSAIDALKDGLKAGYSKDQLRRARKRLGIESVKSSMEGGWAWSYIGGRASEERTEEREERGSQSARSSRSSVRSSGAADTNESNPDEKRSDR